MTPYKVATPDASNIVAPMNNIIYHSTDYRKGKHARVVPTDFGGFNVEVFDFEPSRNGWLWNHFVHRADKDTAIAYADDAF